MEIGVDMPLKAITSILKEQKEWERCFSKAKTLALECSLFIAAAQSILRTSADTDGKSDAYHYFKNHMQLTVTIISGCS